MSPAAPSAPRWRARAQMTPLPTPVPILTTRMWSSPGKHARCSPSAIRFVSLATRTGTGRGKASAIDDVDAVPAGHDRRRHHARRRGLHRAGDAHRHGDDVARGAVRVGQELRQQLAHQREVHVGARRDVDRAPLEDHDVGREVADGEAGPAGAEVGDDDDSARLVEGERRGPPAARALSLAVVGEQAGIEQQVQTVVDRGAREAALAGERDPRVRCARPHQLEEPSGPRGVAAPARSSCHAPNSTSSARCGQTSFDFEQKRV